METLQGGLKLLNIDFHKNTKENVWSRLLSTCHCQEECLALKAEARNPKQINRRKRTRIKNITG